MPEKVDFVVVGAGMAGLAGAALLAREGASVALFDKHSKLGGYAQYFGKEPTYDSATHLIGGCGQGGWTRAALVELGVIDRIELLPLDPLYRAVFPSASYAAPADPERFRQELSALWPSEAAGIARLFTEIDEIGRTYLTMADGPPTGGLLARHQDSTWSGMLDGCTRNPELRAALSALWLFAGLPPERCSALHMAMLWHSFHNQGSAAIRGGVRALTQALADSITERGGTVETRTRVTRILRDRGAVTGVQLEDGREIQTRAVISTASPHDTFEELLAAEGQTAAGYPPLRGFAFSVSAMQVHLLVDGPLDVPARSTILHTTTDLEAAYFDLQRSEPEFTAMVCTVLDHGDAQRAPAGHHLISLFTLSPYGRHDHWNVPYDVRRSPDYRTLPGYVELRERLGDAMVRRAEDVFPGLAGQVRARKVGTPLTLERYTFNTGGAAFGWANIPNQSGPYRPGPHTPFRRLYMAGHWTFPGGSVAAAVTSGRIAARTALAET